ncbi:MAG: glycosyltransferase family 39 protein [Deltaproteobacteria bacterium]|nr:glycosyltransferase family 39 protein [Deltaproteobacteria bacterium]
MKRRDDDGHGDVVDHRNTDRVGRAERLLLALILVFAVSNVIASAIHSEWTWDEPGHVVWSERLVFAGITERQSQPIWDSKTPIMVPNAIAVRAARELGAGDVVTRFVTRLPTLGWYVLLLGMAYKLARRFGPRAGWFATGAVALEPSLQAHASVATVDVAFAFATVFAVWATLRFLESPGRKEAALFGLALGLGVTAKFSGLLLVLLLPLALLAGVRPPPGSARKIAAGIGIAMAVAYAVICVSYGFYGIGAGTRVTSWRAGPFQFIADHCRWMFWPFPRDFLTGIDICFTHNAHSVANTALLGRWYPDGVWYYFVVLWVFKTPIGLVVTQLAAIAMAVRRVRHSDATRRFLLLVVLYMIAYFSLVLRFQVGYRFVLMAVALACILTGSLVCDLPRRGRIAVIILGALALLGQIRFFGNPLSFTNVLVEKKTAYRFLGDSNLDWNQNNSRADEWARDLGAILGPRHTLPGLNLFSTYELSGVLDYERPRHTWIREHVEPIRELGYTHFLFDIDDTTFQKVLDNERTRRPLALAALTCGQHVAPVSGEQFALPPGDTCVDIAKRSDLAIRGAPADLVGLRNEQGNCELEAIGAGRVIWYRLLPGKHTLCAAPRSSTVVTVERVD